MLDKRTIPFGALISYLGLFVVVFIVQFILIFGFGFDINSDTDALRMGSLSNLLGYGAGFIILYVLYFKYLKERFVDTLKNIPRTLVYVVSGFIGLYTLSLLVTLFYKLIGLYVVPDNQEMLNTLAEAARFDQIALIIYAVFLAPFVEEMVFRLGIMTLISNMFANSKVNKKVVIAIAITVSSFLFGLIHVTGDIEQILNYAVLGVVLAFVYYKTDNIYTSIYLHMVYNAIAAIAMFLL